MTKIYPKINNFDAKKEKNRFRFFSFGRGDRTRTCDSLVPNQERYQLRYTSVA